MQLSVKLQHVPMDRPHRQRRYLRSYTAHWVWEEISTGLGISHCTHLKEDTCPGRQTLKDEFCSEPTRGIADIWKRKIHVLLYRASCSTSSQACANPSAYPKAAVKDSYIRRIPGSKPGVPNVPGTLISFTLHLKPMVTWCWWTPPSFPSSPFSGAVA